MKKYILYNLGLGDMLVFICHILLYHNINTSLIIQFDREYLNIKLNHEYFSFCKKFIQHMLPKYGLIFEDEIALNNIKISNTNIIKYIPEPMDISIALQRSDIVNYFKNIFSQSMPIDTIPIHIDNSYITIITKIRDIDKQSYNNKKQHFFNTLNTIHKKIIIIGEKEIEYNKDYKEYGTQKIFSIYQDCIDNINQDNLIDFSLPYLGIQTPNMENLLHSIYLMYNSSGNIMFGRGGLFCIGLFTQKLKSLHSASCDYIKPFKLEYNKQIFTSYNSFTEAILSL